MLRMMLQSTSSFVAMAALSGLHERQKTMRRTSCWSLERADAASHNDTATRSIAKCCCGAAARVAARWSLQCNAMLGVVAHVVAALGTAVQRCSNNAALQCNATLELALLLRWALQCNATL
jgi:hypothetical protein